MTDQKSQLINFSSVSRGKNQKGLDLFKLYLNKEDAMTLAQELVNKAESTELGVRFDVHIGTVKEGNKFETAYAFVNEKQQRPSGNTQYQPKNQGQNAGGGQSFKDKIEAQKQKIQNKQVG